MCTPIVFSYFHFFLQVVLGDEALNLFPPKTNQLLSSPMPLIDWLPIFLVIIWWCFFANDAKLHTARSVACQPNFLKCFFIYLKTSQKTSSVWTLPLWQAHKGKIQNKHIFPSGKLLQDYTRFLFFTDLEKLIHATFFLFVSSRITGRACVCVFVFSGGAAFCVTNVKVQPETLRCRENVL